MNHNYVLPERNSLAWIAEDNECPGAHLIAQISSATLRQCEYLIEGSSHHRVTQQDTQKHVHSESFRVLLLERLVDRKNDFRPAVPQALNSTRICDSAHKKALAHKARIRPPAQLEKFHTA